MIARATAGASRSKSRGNNARALVAAPMLGRSPSCQRRAELKAERLSEMRPDLIPGHEKLASGAATSDANADDTQFVMTPVIILSTAQLSMQCQWPAGEYPTMARLYFVADVIFLLLFMCEIMIKLSARRWEYFNSRWNNLDIVITVGGMCDMWVQVLHGNAAWMGAKNLCMLRFLRVIRLIRVLKGMSEVVVVWDGIMKATGKVAWVLLLLFANVFMFGIFVTTELRSDEELATDLGDVNYFGDLSHCMLTLMNIALLAEWPEIIRPIMHHRPILLPFFLIFMLLSTFGATNILIGFVVDSTTEARREADSKKQRTHLVHACTLWEDAFNKQGLGGGHIEMRRREVDTVEPAQQRMEAIHKVVQVVIDSGCIDFPDGLTPEDVVHLLDFDGNNDLSTEEFESGIGRLLLGNGFQLTCLMLTMMGKMRKESRTLIEDVEQAVSQSWGSMEKQIKKIERKVGAKVQGMSALGSTPRSTPWSTPLGTPRLG